MTKSGFTDLFLKSLVPRTKRYTVYEKDRRYEGFAVDVLPSGKLSFRYRYRLHGKRERVTIGSYPAMSLAAAREQYREMVHAVQKELSPAVEKKRRKATVLGAVKFEALAMDWLANVLPLANKNPSVEQGYLKNYILPTIGGRAVAAIDRSAVWTCINLAKDEGYHQAARRVHSVLKRIFDYAITQGTIDTSPVKGIDPQHIAPARARERVLTPEEIPTWIVTIETSSIPRSMKLALRLLLLIPVRKGELLSAKWSHVDLENRTWDIPKENSKNNTPLRHRLSRQATSIFSELRTLAAGSEWVLPSSKGAGKKPLTKSGINTAIRGLKGLPNGVVIHDLRRTIRTYLTELGVPANVAELCLNHRPTGIKRVYDRSELIDQRFDALGKWESYLNGLLQPKDSKEPSNGATHSTAEAVIRRATEDEAFRSYLLSKLGVRA